MNVLGANLAAMMLPALFGFGPAGLYAMAARVSGVPAEIASQSAGQVFLGEFARATTRSAALRVFFRWSVGLLILAVAVSSAIWVLSPLILPWYLGDDWNGTVRLAPVLGNHGRGGHLGFARPPCVDCSPARTLAALMESDPARSPHRRSHLAGSPANNPLPQVIATLAVVTTAVYVLGWLGCLWAAVQPPAEHKRQATEPQVGSEGPSSWP